MRTAGVIVLLLIFLILFAGCGQKLPTRNTTVKNPWGNTTTTPQGTGSAVQTTVIPKTTSPFVQVTVVPETTTTGSPVPTYRTPPPGANSTANLTLLDEKILIFNYNSTAYSYNLQNPPLCIDYTLTVQNISRLKVETDPVSGAESDITVTYPDPLALFQVTVKDLKTDRIIAQDGYGGQYDIEYSKQVWVRYPGNYYIEFTGNRVTADVKFMTIQAP